MKFSPVFFIAITTLCTCSSEHSKEKKLINYPSFSGIYPHLAFYNSQGECGTGAVVPWAGKLWAVTYSPHEPKGSDDKLYEISSDLERIVRPESIGGTPANRMIHQESNQLFIGPYAIDQARNVRAIPYTKMMGRHTGNARHLSDPANKIYYATMEAGFYEVDVQALDVHTLYEDGNSFQKEGDLEQYSPLLPGAHGKGLYSGQGVMVFSNNGEANEASRKYFDVESGALAEWNGSDWKVIRRNQFVEVTGPAGIYGNLNPETDPIWTTGFDHKSLIVGVRDDGSWSFYRLPKASHSYDGAHGWNTEWPRIRDVGTPEQSDYLMTMHGMFWQFPEGFTSSNSAGIRPRSAYLKVIADFARWNEKLVFGCDDSAQREFLNKRKAKGGIEGPGQSNSNLWFTSISTPDHLGPDHASGAVWLNEEIQANEYSEPFIFDGWPERNAWIKNHNEYPVTFILEIDKVGNGNWTYLNSMDVVGGGSKRISFSKAEKGEWIRVSTNNDTKATVVFSYSEPDLRKGANDSVFNGLIKSSEPNTSGGLLYGLGNNRRALGISARNPEGDKSGYYELDSAMNLVLKTDAATQQFIEERFAIPRDVVSVEESSVLIIDDVGRRWRLPKGNSLFDQLISNAETRICREVATERDLFNCHGTFYELPAENADGFAKIRPIASHDFKIHDYASYRGMLIISGVDRKNSNENAHIITSNDSKLALWAGAIDDLWKLGKPIGLGGPLKNSEVKASEPSDPYLIGFYDKRSVSIHHNQSYSVKFTLEVNPIGHGPWLLYENIVVEPEETINHVFPDDFEARWIRITTDRDCKATAWFIYE